MADSYHFTEAATIKFIRLYKKEELLWNPELPSYSIRAHRREAIKRIVKGMNLKDLEPRHIKLKIRSHRDIYTREMKKLAQNKDPEKKRPFWMKELSFLKLKFNDFGEMSNTDETIASESEAQDMLIEYIDENYQTATEECTNNKLFTSTKQEDQDTDNSTDFNTEKINYCDSESEFNAVPESQETREIFKTIGRNQEEILSTLRSHISVDPLKEDLFDNFAKYVASLLRDLPKAKALALQPKIISMITAEHIKNG